MQIKPQNCQRLHITPGLDQSRNFAGRLLVNVDSGKRKVVSPFVALERFRRPLAWAARVGSRSKRLGKLVLGGRYSSSGDRPTHLDDPRFLGRAIGS